MTLCLHWHLIKAIIKMQYRLISCSLLFFLCVGSDMEAALLWKKKEELAVLN